MRVMLLCPGLDHAHRGFETFARECFTAFRGDPEIDMELVKGSGPPAPGERVVRTPTRDAAATRGVARIVGARPFRVEHVAFALALAPRIGRLRPDVLFFSEWDVGRVLAFAQRRSRRRTPLILSNGTMATAGFGHLDRVQQLTPAARDAALAGGDDPGRHVQIPLGFDFGPQSDPPTPEERRALRERLGLPVERHVLVSTAALNTTHKRLDYVIDEVARLPEPRPFLVLAGQVEPETPRIRDQARARLGPDGFTILTLAPAQVAGVLRAGDQFVLASLYEGLPRGLVEALGQGLPCLIHDYAVTRYALGPHGVFGDLTRPGALAELLASEAARDLRPASWRARREFARERFSWESLRPAYRDLFASVL